MNLGRYISRSAGHYRTRSALIFGDRRYTYEELERRTNRLAQGLSALGLKKGDRVAIQSWNRPEVVETEVACYKAGMVRIPINARLSAAEAIEILSDAEAGAFITDQKHGEEILSQGGTSGTVKRFICLDAPLEGKIRYEDLLADSPDDLPDVEVEPEDLAVLTYSSGTTGKLKGIMQSYGNRLAMIRKALMFPEIRLRPGDIFVHVGPITHASGMLLMPVMFCGACNVIIGRFDVPLLLETIQRERANYTMLVPAMIHMIIAYPGVRQYDLSSLKGIFYGAAPISPAVVEQAIALFGPILSQGYGMSETTSFISVLTASEHLDALNNCPARLSSCGRPVFDTEVRVVNEEGRDVKTGEMGEIIARGADIMQGYYKDPGLTAETIQNGWIHSSDMAKVDDEGYIYIVDRKKDMIISGGFNVYPSEVENILYTHPAVFEACVVAVPDEKWGEAIKAVVVLKPGTEVTAEALIAHCERFLSSFKKPRSVDFVKELPKNPNGKIAKRLVKDFYWTGKERRVN